MIYLDTSALAKLVVEEAESAALASWLDEHEDEVLFTSALSKVELVRAANRRSPRPGQRRYLSSPSCLSSRSTRPSSTSRGHWDPTPCGVWMPFSSRARSR